MSIFNFSLGCIHSTTIPIVVPLRFSSLSSSSLRMFSAFANNEKSLPVAKCSRKISRLPDYEKEIGMPARHSEKQNPLPPHWKFCYKMLCKESLPLAFGIQQFDTDVRDAQCISWLVMLAIDVIEDDSSIAIEVKVPILMAFHRHIYDCEWQFACGTGNRRVLMENFNHVSTAFLELRSSYREIIEDTVMMMGAGMAKFAYKEVDTIHDYDEYCHCVAGLPFLAWSKLFHASGVEDLPPSTFFHSLSLFLKKADTILDYMEDINEIPKPRMFWPRQIWSKYVDRLEDLKDEKNSVKALHCLNDMVTNALMHAQDCLKYFSTPQDPVIFQGFAVSQLLAMGTLASCYNNIQVFRGVQKWNYDVAIDVFDQIETISDFYQAFYNHTCMLKSKIDPSDPNATTTKDTVEAILKTLQEVQS